MFNINLIFFTPLTRHMFLRIYNFLNENESFDPPGKRVGGAADRWRRRPCAPARQYSRAAAGLPVANIRPSSSFIGSTTASSGRSIVVRRICCRGRGRVSKVRAPSWYCCYWPAAPWSWVRLWSRRRNHRPLRRSSASRRSPLIRICGRGAIKRRRARSWIWPSATSPPSRAASRIVRVSPSPAHCPWL